MEVFIVGLLTLLFCTAIVYIVIFSFIYYWHLKVASFIVVPIIWTFNFFWKGFVIVAAVSLLFNYIPYLINYL